MHDSGEDTRAGMTNKKRGMVGPGKTTKKKPDTVAPGNDEKESAPRSARFPSIRSATFAGSYTGHSEPGNAAAIALGAASR